MAHILYSNLCCLLFKFSSFSSEELNPICVCGAFIAFVSLQSSTLCVSAQDSVDVSKPREQTIYE